MINIVILTSGHGSIILQQSIHKLVGSYANVQILISGYDNAKSSLLCRQIFNNNILGISDLRKNHITQYGIQHGYTTSFYKSIYNWLKYRLPRTWNKDSTYTYKFIKKQYIKNG